MLLAFLLLMGSEINPTLSKSNEDLEYEVKAAMIYNFTRFIEWPSSTWKREGEPMIVGVIGSSPIESNLTDTMQGKTHSGHEIRVIRIHAIEEIKKCQMVFVAKSEKDRMEAVLSAANDTGALTVSDIEGFVPSGGMIGFIFETKRIRFEISPATANQAGITISSKLLQLAKLP